MDRSSSASSYASSSSCRKSSAAVVTDSARSREGDEGGWRLDLEGISAALPFGEGVMREKSRLRVSSTRDKGSDHRLGKGTRAVTLESVPVVRVRGIEAGMRLLIS